MSNTAGLRPERRQIVKRIFILGTIVIFLAYIVPVAFQYYRNHTEAEESIHTVQNVEIPSDSQGQVEQNAENDGDDAKQGEDSTQNETTLAVSVNGTIREMPLEEYVAGAVAAEMPASFPDEALKAQAVAARTFAMYKQSLGTDDKHSDAVVCDDPAHCAAFVDLDGGAEELWGSKADEWTEKVRAASLDTAGQIVTYGGEPIAAVFHAAAAKETEAAVSVWGSDIPYLVGVDSSGDDACPKYDASVTLSAEEFRQIMLKQYPDINLTGLPETWFTDIQTSEAGGVTSCKIGGKEMKGTAVRTLFALNSTHFTVSTTDTSITFHTEGYGHGVGMSQYGAKGMAEGGSSYKDILLHYYTGTELSDISS